MKYPACLLAVAVLLVAGCIPSHDVSSDDMTQWWALTAADKVVASRQATDEASQHELGIPLRWTIRHSDSVIGSTVTLVRAMDAIKAGAVDVEFALAPEHIQPLIDMLADTRATMGELEDMLDEAGATDENRWAETLAEALVTVEQLAREATAAEGDEASGDEPLGMAAEPLLDLLSSLMGGQSGQDVLADLDVQEVGRLRQSMVQMVVRMGFDIAGRQGTPELGMEAARKLQASEDLAAMRGELTDWLSKQLNEAPPAATTSRQAVTAALEYGPKAILMFERFLQQWPKMDSISVDIAPGGEDIAVVLTVRVKDGQEVRIDKIMTGVPVVVFRGDSRISIVPDGTPAGDAIVSFDPVGDGAVELRFEGLLYGLVRLFAFPLDSGPLREIRVATSSRSRGDQLINVAVLMESSRDTDDPRRMLSVQDVRRKRVVRDVLETRTVVDRSETTVSYITPGKRYTYQRITHEGQK